MGELGGVQTNTGARLRYIESAEVQKVLAAVKEPLKKTELFAAMCRLNTLYMIMKAGSGHIGSSFSAMDIVAHLWLNVLKNPNQPLEQYSDTYFSSKGHDAPGLYATLIGLGLLPGELLHQLRRLGGLPGHPDVSTPYIATNTGSLGMGVSKAHGMALACRLQKKSGRFYVLTGDGELQEGQFWESLQPAANAKLSELTIIVDHNKIQSDAQIKDTSHLGDLEEKLCAFGWHVVRVDGHNIAALARALEECVKIPDRPQIIIADTVKGKGVSFMERLEEDGYYKFHSGAPSLEDYQKAAEEILQRIKNLGANPQITEMDMPTRAAAQNPQRLIKAYSEELLELAQKHREIVAMDADLILDTGLIPFKQKFPDRYIEAGIAEQDMVSRAGGMALQGLLPIVHSFACFLPARANEQFYNNASEKKKIIYVASLAGLLPAGPGHSHQSVRDISITGSIPGLTLIEPATEEETKLALRWAVEENKESTYIRLVSIPVEIPFSLPVDYRPERGKGEMLREGGQVAIISYGPVMLSEGYKAAELLEEKGVSTAVINLPWLNAVDEKWLGEILRGCALVVTLDDHYRQFGQGAMLAQALSSMCNAPRQLSLGLEEIPACGTNAEALSHHGLDAYSLSERIKRELA